MPLHFMNAKERQDVGMPERMPDLGFPKGSLRCIGVSSVTVILGWTYVCSRSSTLPRAGALEHHQSIGICQLSTVDLLHEALSAKPSDLYAVWHYVVEGEGTNFRRIGGDF